MKNAKTLTAALILAGSFLAAGAAAAADNAVVVDRLSPGDYCHMKFPAIDPGTLGTDHPTLENPGSGDSIDFYGPCDETPTGRDQVEEQMHDDQLSRSRD